MNVQSMQVTKTQAAEALRMYKLHRNTYDKRDWEIERIYRQISKGKTVISAFNAIKNAGTDTLGLPKLALMKANQEFCNCWVNSRAVTFTNIHRSRAAGWHFEIPWPEAERTPYSWQINMPRRARLPRIPPQYRPAANKLGNYHLLWEAEWTQQHPIDPYLLRRIGKDAWVVLAGWELTDVELAVMQAHTVRM